MRAYEAHNTQQNISISGTKWVILRVKTLKFTIRMNQVNNLLLSLLYPLPISIITLPNYNHLLFSILSLPRPYPSLTPILFGLYQSHIRKHTFHKWKENRFKQFIDMFWLYSDRLIGISDMYIQLTRKRIMYSWN